MYVTYDLVQRTRSGRTANYPKVKRGYIAGDVTDWKEGRFTKRTGRKVKGVKITYTQERAAFEHRLRSRINVSNLESSQEMLKIAQRSCLQFFNLDCCTR